MKPQLSIGLSSAGVELLHRGRDGWRTVDAIPLDDPEFSARLGAARERVHDLVKTKPVAKLIIPDSEILYRTVHAPGDTDAEREAQIAAAIDGLTPYAIDELVFDWCGIGDELQVAVVARETLAEAESFAAEHGLDAVAFVAAPDDARFMGEVYFGRTSMAAWLVPPDETIERDAAPVVSVGPVPAAVPRPSLPEGSAPAAPPRAGNGAVDAGPAASQPAPPPRGTANDDPSGEDVAAAVRAAGKTAAPTAAPHASAPVAGPRPGDAQSSVDTARGAESGTGLSGGIASVLPWFGKGKADAPAPATAPEATGATSPALGGAERSAVSGSPRAPTPPGANGASSGAGDSGAAVSPKALADSQSAEQLVAPIAFSSRRGAAALSAKEVTAAEIVPDIKEKSPAPTRGAATPPEGKTDQAEPGSQSGLKSLGARFEKMRARLTGTDRAGATQSARSAGSVPGRGETGVEKGPEAGSDTSATAGEKAKSAKAASAAPDADTPVANGTAGAGALSSKARALLKRPGRAEVGKDAKTAPAPAASNKGASGSAASKPLPDTAPNAGARGAAASTPPPQGSAPARPELKQALAAPVADLTAKGGRKPLTAEAADTEAEKLTIFGARGTPPAERGFVSRGLMLTGGLVLVLLAVAVWAVYFTSGPEQQASVPAPSATEAELPPTTPVPGAEAPADAAGLTDTDTVPTFDEQAQIDATIAGIEEALAEAAPPLDDTPIDPATPDATDAATVPAAESAGPGPALAAETDGDAAPLSAPGASASRDASDALRTDGGDAVDAPFTLSALTPPSGSAALMPEPPPAPAPFGTEPIPGAASSPAFEPPPEVIEGRPAAVPPPRPAGLAPQDDAQLPQTAPASADTPETDVAQAAAPAAPAPGAVVDPVIDTGAEMAAEASDDTAQASREAQARDEGMALFTEADPVLAALRPQARPGAPDAPAEPATAAPDMGTEAAQDAETAVAAAASALTPAGSDGETGPHNEAEAAARAQGLALFTVADPELAVARPESRPETVLAAAVADATPATPAEPDAAEAEMAEAVAAPETNPEITASPGGLVLAALRPAARPESLIARPADETPADAAPEVTSDSPYAVAQSLRPSQRPGDFSRRVQQTMAAVQQRQERAPAAQVQQASAPARSATPQIPTSASVAREATQTRAINLRQLNLLGTFGTRSNRTALVRESNGRVQQVRVGDRLNRGQVTAIGDGELTYVRSGRTHRLRVGERS